MIRIDVRRIFIQVSSFELVMKSLLFDSFLYRLDPRSIHMAHYLTKTNKQLNSTYRFGYYLG